MHHRRHFWFELKHTDLSFVDSSPFRFSVSAPLAAAPERVFEIFATPEGMRDWVFGFDDCIWLGPAPWGVGARREFRLKGLSFRERFLAWEPGRRLCFAIEEMTVPLMRRMVEDVRIERAGGAACWITWHVFYEPSLLLRPIHPVARLLFRAGYQSSMDGLSRYVLENREQRLPVV